MAAPEIWIIVMAAIELLAFLGMGAAAFLMYRRAKDVAGRVQPAVRESKAIAAHGKGTALATKDRALSFYEVSHQLVQHVGRKVQTTTRLAREVVHPELAPLQQAARTVAGPEGLAARLFRLREAGKIAAGQGNGHDAHG
jgi:hypothetical protein